MSWIGYSTFYRLPMVLMSFSFSVYVCVFSFNMFHLSYPIISKQRNWIWSGKISILPITSRSTPHAWFFSSSRLLLPIIYIFNISPSVYVYPIQFISAYLFVSVWLSVTQKWHYLQKQHWSISHIGNNEDSLQLHTLHVAMATS